MALELRRRVSGCVAVPIPGVPSGGEGLATGSALIVGVISHDGRRRVEMTVEWQWFSGVSRLIFNVGQVRHVSRDKGLNGSWTHKSRLANTLIVLRIEACHTHWM